MKKQWEQIASDLPAAIVVFLIAVPLCLGIALGSNAPLFSGLIAGVVGGIFVGWWSGSQLSITGPAAGLAVVVAGGLARLPSYEVFLVAVVLAGTFQILLGRLKAGVVGDFIPNAVIKGMMAAIGIILILKQLPHFFGTDTDYEGDLSFFQPDARNTFSEIWYAAGDIHPGAFFIAILSLGIIAIWRTPRFRQIAMLHWLPGPFVAVLAGVLVNTWWLRNNAEWALEASHRVNLPVPDTLNGWSALFAFPDFSGLTNPRVWWTAPALALVASLESLLSVEAIDRLDSKKRVTPNNRELIAQGGGNIVSGLLGGLPVTALVIRSSANVTYGANSKAAAMLQGVMLLIAVALLPHWLNRVPLACLAAVLIFVGYKMLQNNRLRDIYHKGWSQFIPFLVTAAAIILTDLLVGILIGIGVSAVFVMYKNFHKALLMVHDGNNYLLRFRKDVNFLNKPLVRQTLDSIPAGAYLIIDVSKTDYIDLDVIETINEFLVQAQEKGIQVELKKSATNPQHRHFQQPHLPEVSAAAMAALAGALSKAK